MDWSDTGFCASDTAASFGRGFDIWFPFGQSWARRHYSFPLGRSVGRREFSKGKLLFLNRCRIHVFRHSYGGANFTRVCWLRHGQGACLGASFGRACVKFTEHVGYSRSYWHQEDAYICGVGDCDSHCKRNDIWFHCQVIEETMEKDIKKIVREGYAKVAKQGSSCCSASSCCSSSINARDISKTIGYTDDEMNAVPDGANLGLGCGNPVAIASLKEGDVVLDLGSGAGFDAFLAAKKVGKYGRVIGVDMTEEMLERA